MGNCRLLLAIVGLCGLSLAVIGFHGLLLGFVGLCWPLWGFVGFVLAIIELLWESKPVGVGGNMSWGVEICHGRSKCICGDQQAWTIE